MANVGAESNSLVGSLLGKDYRVLEQIGLGGMAVVYLVEHQTLLKRFAAKVLSVEHAANKEARARFAQEAHAASQLDHENIVTISDFGITPDERPFYVMELLRGQTLMARIDAGPMTLPEVVAVSVPVARALAHAHAEGVIHRDVKPDNVFLVQRSQGRWNVKVLDFGIAKVSSNPSLTKMGQALGSPNFMSPEACRGDEVDQRSDLYSFGIILFLMLTGKLPFDDESLLKVLQMQVSTPVPSLREINPELSPELEAVVMRALAKNPDDRYPTMETLLFDLQMVLPEGSDSLLIQAQFGTSSHDTPFPSQSLRMIALSSQRLMIGDKDAAKELAAASVAKQFPPGPKVGRKRGGFIALGLLAVLGGGGAFAYKQMQASDEKVVRTEEPVVATNPVVTPPANDPTPPSPAPPIEPPKPAADVPVVDPPTPVEDPPVATAKVAEPAPATVDKVPEKKPASKATPAPKKVAVAATAPKKAAAAPAAETKPATGSGSAVAPPVAAIAVTPAAVPKEPPPVTAPGPGSAAPPVVTPKPTQAVVAPVVNVGSLDATPTIASLDVNGPLPTSVVRRSVERILPALRACYRTAAKARQATPAVNLTLSFEVDEGSVATRVAAGGTNFGTLASCARSAASQLQTQQAPDVGTANVVVAITFRPI